MLPILLIGFAIIIFILIKKVGFLRTKPFIALGVLSVLWWLFLVFDQLRTDLKCSPDDDFCNSGNTVTGDITWGSLMAALSLSLVWSVTIGLTLLIRLMRKQKQPRQK